MEGDEQCGDTDEDETPGAGEKCKKKRECGKHQCDCEEFLLTDAAIRDRAGGVYHDVDVFIGDVIPDQRSKKPAVESRDAKENDPQDVGVVGLYADGKHDGACIHQYITDKFIEVEWSPSG